MSDGTKVFYDDREVVMRGTDRRGAGARLGAIGGETLVAVDEALGREAVNALRQIAGITFVAEDAHFRPAAMSWMKPSEFATWARDMARTILQTHGDHS